MGTNDVVVTALRCTKPRSNKELWRVLVTARIAGRLVKQVGFGETELDARNMAYDLLGVPKAGEVNSETR